MRPRRRDPRRRQLPARLRRAAGLVPGDLRLQPRRLVRPAGPRPGRRLPGRLHAHRRAGGLARRPRLQRHLGRLGRLAEVRQGARRARRAATAALSCSEKRERKYTASGGISDHWVGSLDAYAVDIDTATCTMAYPGGEADRTARAIAAALGHAEPHRASSTSSAAPTASSCSGRRTATTTTSTSASSASPSDREASDDRPPRRAGCCRSSLSVALGIARAARTSRATTGRSSRLRETVHRADGKHQHGRAQQPRPRPARPALRSPRPKARTRAGRPRAARRRAPLAARASRLRRVEAGAAPAGRCSPCSARALLALRVGARRRRRYVRHWLLPYRADEATPDQVRRLIESWHQMTLRRWWQRLLRGQPSLALELHAIPDAAGTRLRLMVATPRRAGPRRGARRAADRLLPRQPPRHRRAPRRAGLAARGRAAEEAPAVHHAGSPRPSATSSRSPTRSPRRWRPPASRAASSTS